MSIVETVYPDGDISSGSWSNAPVYDDTDETGTQDGDTTYTSLIQVSAGTTVSEFEVSIQNPTKWVSALNVRDAESWKAVLDLSVRDAESWKAVKALGIRDAESWKTVIPQLTVRVTAKRLDNLASDPISGTVKLKFGTTIVDSASLSLTNGSYVETALTVNASALARYDPTDMRVAVEGSVTVNDELNGSSELRVTQIKVELND